MELEKFFVTIAVDHVKNVAPNQKVNFGSNPLINILSLIKEN